MSAVRSEAVRVVVRCRPMSQREKSQGHTQIIDMWPQRGIVYITNPRRPSAYAGKMFTFDSVYDWNSSQDDLYENTVKPLVYSVLDGYNGTIFAYGQTGTGKTHTMLGSRCNPKEKGVTSKCFEDVFRHIAYASERTTFSVRASYLEIYQEEARDLLTADVRKKPLREDAARGVYVKGLQWVECRCARAMERVMRMGNLNRATAATNMNEHSSRSHAIFQISIEMQDRAVKRNNRLQCGRRVGKLNLVDLAGSERQCKTGAVGERLKESGKINLSLSALGNVISALVDGRSSHIPYRDSKLTQLLQDSLGGSSKCIMIANIGPASYNYDESLMTLRYASRAKYIKNRPTRNESGSLGTPISHYGEEMRALQSLLTQAPGQEPSRYIQHAQGAQTRVVSPVTLSEDSTESPDTARGRSRRRGLRARLETRRRGLGPHRRPVWKLHGKYPQETTVMMVRWIQEQIRNSGCNDDEEEAEEGAQDLTEAEIGVQNLVDDLSDAVVKEDMIPSLTQLTESDRCRSQTTRTFLKLAAEVKELRQRALRQQRRQRTALRSEQARLRKAVALRHAVLRAYLTEREHAEAGAGIGLAELPSPELPLRILSETKCMSPVMTMA